MNSQQKTQRGFHLLIAAAGSGLRLGHEIPKQYLKIGGKALLRHTLENALRWAGMKSCHVIINPDHQVLYEEATEGLTLPPPLYGGKERNISIYNVLKEIPHVKKEDLIFIHDGARPFTAQADIVRLLDGFETYRAATLATPVSDTLRKNKNSHAGAIIDRNGLWALQTPQAFYYEDILRAHEEMPENATVTDDTSLVSTLGIEVALVEGSRNNIKITTKDDLEMAEALLNNYLTFRTGQGFDVHAFEKEPSARKLILCGVEIEHELALAGHSDADVGLHALTDAILGAIGEGDIGQHFPPSDDTFKDMDSRIFLEKAMEMVANKGGAVQNIDLTLICEAPKVGPHRDAMRTKVAEICGLQEHQVNIKATTTERLGFTGRKEGIAAQAIATVKMPV